MIIYSKSFPMILEQFPDYDDPYRIGVQTLTWDDGDFKGKFHAQNLNGCPEDAIIGRDLFDARDFINAVQFGIRLAHSGYDRLEIIEKNN